jgi:tetratricopeptide (TPR) repeat protein/serine/threonine protein kinase
MTEQPAEQSIFLHAIGLPSPADRAAYLDGVCRDNLQLRTEIEALLSAHYRLGVGQQQTSAQQAPPDPENPITQAEAQSTEAPCTIIGPYKLLQEIGEGGMGTVWMAEQTHPVQRKVALKIIKPGMDSRRIIARFEAERQALALMDHPNIAKVLDAGTIGEPSRVGDRVPGDDETRWLALPGTLGQPYFVMELVKGLPITKFCDQRRLTLNERLELFGPVCQAVQHAHQKGIIHRDLKPSNVLVALYDGKPVPKIIDFGVAKATGPKLTEKTLYTEFGAVVGTLEYMSPEQAEVNQLDVDTRSDIYSLGVLLYELLTGTTPLDRNRLKATAILEALRLIREEEPPRPSNRLSSTDELPSIAANRCLEPKKLSGLVRGELDWIVMKALEKDRDRRYESANSLAHDVQRYLNDEPVLACPPSAWYRFRKLARRNKGKLALGGLILFFLMLLGAGAGWAVRNRAALEKEIAQDRDARQAALESDVARALSDAQSAYTSDKLAEGMVAVKQAKRLWAGSTGNEQLQEQLSRWISDLEMAARLEEIPLERLDEAGANFDLGSANGAYRAAFRHYNLDVEALDIEAAAERIKGSAIKGRLVAALDNWVMSRYVPGISGWEHLLAVARRADPDPWRDRFREAFQQRNRKALAEVARKPNLPDQPVATLLLLAAALWHTQEPVASVEILRQAQRRHPGDFWLNEHMGLRLMALRAGRKGEEIGFLRAAVALRPQSPGARLNLGWALLHQELVLDAEAEFRETLLVEPNYFAAHLGLGNTLLAQRKYREAEVAYLETLKLRKDFLPALSNLGTALQRQGKFAEAVEAYQKALQLQKDNAKIHLGLGKTYCDQGNFAAAEAELQEALRLHQQGKDIVEPGETRLDLASLHANLGIALENQGKLGEAEKHFRKACDLKPNDPDYLNMLGAFLCDYKREYDAALEAFNKALQVDPKYAMAHCNIANVMRNKGEISKAVASFQKALELDPELALAHNNLGNIYMRQGKLAEAMDHYRKAIRSEPSYAMAHYNLGNALLQLNKLPEAAEEFRAAVHFKPGYTKAHHALGQALWQQDKVSEAAAACREALRLEPKNASGISQLAWILVTCPDPKMRDTAEGLKLAKKAVDLAPKDPVCWRTLGLAYYRAGEWKNSAEALKTSANLFGGGDLPGAFALSMAFWQMGEKEEAREAYRTAIEFIKANREAIERNPFEAKEVARFRAEVAQVMGEKD